MNAIRIVSLLSSATEMLHALGLGGLQVGRSHECDYPDEVKRLPVCTRPMFDVGGSSAEIDRLVKERIAAAASIYQVDVDRVRELAPTHVLTQTLCEVCAVSLADVERAFLAETRLTCAVVPMTAGSLEGVWRDLQRIADSIGETERGERVVGSLQIHLNEKTARVAAAEWHPRVAAIEWIQPLMAAGNWIPELLERAGAVSLFGKAGEHSPWMNWAELEAADPDVIIAMPCGFDLERTRSEMRHVDRLPGWRRVRAVQAGEVYVCDGNQYMNRPGPRLVESLQIFGEILHPEVFGRSFEGTGWERLGQD